LDKRVLFKNKNENKFLHFRNPSEEGPPARIQMDITAFDPTFMVQGEHAFKNILRKMPQVEILNQKNWWWATERVSRSDPAQPVWNVSYVEAFTLRSK